MPGEEIKKITPETESLATEIPGDTPLIPKINPITTETQPVFPDVKEIKSAKPIPSTPFNSEKRQYLKRLLAFFRTKKGKWTLGALVGLILLVLISSIFVTIRARAFYRESQELMAAAQSQDLVAIKKELGESRTALGKLKGSYRFVSWTKFIPFLGNYVRDGGHAINAASYGFEAGEILLEVVEPYADLLGFNNGGEEPGNGEKTTQERIDFIVQTLPDLIPKMDSLSAKTALVKEEIDKINPNRYPVTFRGQPLRAKIKIAVEGVSTASEFITNAKPLIEEAEYMLGIDETREYLVLFQNDKELRPTGGFLTAYSVMEVENARFEPVSSDDIYNLDARYKPVNRAPEPIINYIKGPYILEKNIRLRDSNWSPDFKESMDIFTEEIEGLGLDTVDGIIAVDTQLLVNILDVIGPIGVPGFGNFSTEIIPECNCPQVIYELESFADVEGPIIWDPITGEIILSPPNADNRKRIIGPLMNSIMSNALGQPKEKLPALFEGVFKSLIEKHVLFYMKEESAQAAVEAFGIAGRIKDYQGDYLHINDANLGGRKSNLYVTQEVEQDIEVARDGVVTKTLTITYKNPEKHDGWLNSVLPNWVRVYVPRGSELIDVSGLEETEEPYEEFGKTVFAGYFELRPEGVAKVTLTYTLPEKINGDYNLFIQKQPGKDMPLYIVNMDKKVEEFFLKTDKELNF